MTENNKDRRNNARQGWTPHWLLELLYRGWRVVFAAGKIALGALATVLLIGVVCGFAFVGILGDYLQDEILPMSYLDPYSFEYDQNSYLYYVDAEGQIQEYQKVFAETSSDWASYEDIPENLINAAIAIEDHRFNEHQGVDWITTVKATARMFFGDASVGGSSITQQLIKNMLLFQDDTADDVTVQRKVLEIFRAIQLEKTYDKQTIMELYMNFIYLGQGCRGVRSAAEVYFGKELEKLTLAECASLIGITNNPSLFDPYSNDVFTYRGEDMNGMQRNQHRQRLVLGAMLEYGMITREEYDEAISQELVLKNGVDPEDRLAQCPNTECGYKDTVSTYTVKNGIHYCPVCNTETSVDQSASQDTYSWFTDLVLEDVAKEMAASAGMAWNSATERLMMQHIQNGGYHIYTTLDLRVQEQVDKIYTDLTQIPDARGGQQLQSAIVIVDNRTGDIVGLAGGVGEKEGYHDWSRATDSERQSGSSIKPLSVYAPAFEIGAITPATVIKDIPNRYDAEGTPWPLNDDRRYQYSRTIYSSIVSSVNAVSANTLEKIGVNYSYKFAKEKFGLSTLVDKYMDAGGMEHTDMDMAPLALGAQTWGVTVRDMANAFATFSNNGVYREARTFTKVYDSEGNVAINNTQDSLQLLSEKTVDYMNYCLQNATLSGTGTEAKLSGMNTAGKTGTTGDNKDKWYCGYTGYYTAAVWCGFDTPEYIRASGNPAAQLFKKVMQPLHSGKTNVPLYDSSKMVKVEICLDCGKLATDACRNDVRKSMVNLSRVTTVSVYEEDIPKGSCRCHVEVNYCTTGNGVANVYCQHFAQVDSSVVLQKKSLVQMTQAEIDELLLAKEHNLNSSYLLDNYVYLVTETGRDAPFKGFNNDINLDTDLPYKGCTVHTAQAWEEYLAQHPVNPEPDPEPSEPDPSEPSDPAPSDPGSGTEPGGDTPNDTPAAG